MKTTISTLVLFGCMSIFGTSPAFSGDVFNANPQRLNFGSDPSICKDPQIRKHEQANSSTATAITSQQAEITAQTLESRRMVEHRGVCLSGAASSVVFVPNQYVADANRIADIFASSPNPTNPNGYDPNYNDRYYNKGGAGNNGGNNVQPPPAALAGAEEARRRRCEKVWMQNHSFRDFPSCEGVIAQNVLPGRVTKNEYNPYPFYTGTYNDAYSQRPVRIKSLQPRIPTKDTRKKTALNTGISKTQNKPIVTTFTANIFPSFPGSAEIVFTMVVNSGSKPIDFSKNYEENWKPLKPKSKKDGFVSAEGKFKIVGGVPYLVVRNIVTSRGERMDSEIDLPLTKIK
jgi:hypothetical protein